MISTLVLVGTINETDDTFIMEDDDIEVSSVSYFFVILFLS